MTPVDREPAKFTMIGHVDTGKSTICGQLLAKSNWIDQRELEKIFNKAVEDKMDRWKWARILDIYEEEALRGKTHEYISIPFEYNETAYELVDTPGHQIFIRSMIEGIQGVKIGCLVVSMINNEFVTSFDKGSLKEHLIIMKASGIEKIIILANKMDAVDWSQTVFEEKCQKIQQYLTRVGYVSQDVTAIPISGWLGIGLTDTVDMPSWYQGLSLLDTLGLQNKNVNQKVDKSDRIDLTGEMFILDTRIINYDSIITIGFESVFHINGDEYDVALIGIKNNGKEFIKNGDKCYTIWKFNQETKLTSDRVIIRKDTNTIGIGKIMKVFTKTK